MNRSKKIMKAIALGLISGCLVYTLMNFIYSLFYTNQEFIFNALDIRQNILGCFIVGLGFSLPSLIYDWEAIPMALRSVIHMGLGFAIFFPTAFRLEWIPSAGWNNILFAALAAIVIGMVIWLGFYLYYYRLAKKVNAALAKKNKAS